MWNVRKTDFTTVLCDSDNKPIPGTERNVCILWNQTRLSTEEVEEMIKDGSYEYDDRVIVTTPTQAYNLKDK